MERARGLQRTTPAAMELRRGCSGARPGMQWSSAAAAVERSRGCNGASLERRAPVAAMELRVGCNGASSERRAPVAAMKLRRGCNGARRGRQWSFAGTPAVLRRSFFSCRGAAMDLQWSFPGGRRRCVELGCTTPNPTARKAV
uniref:Uncharacterized protein n=1 Tax=Aegilops tauschii subsp. strangulata TaxID=200361 RepID=A0A453R058_AEGTS